MESIINIFHIVLYQPLFNVLVLLYQYLPGRDFGIAVIVLTLIIRIILYPLMIRSIRSQKALAQIQPKLQEIQRKFKEDKERQAKEMMALYQKEKINPFGGCLPLLLQLPILFTLYYVFLNGLKPDAIKDLYVFISNPGAINPFFLSLINLAQPSIFLAILAGISQFFQSKTLMPATAPMGRGDQASQLSSLMQKQMLYLLPVFTVFILWNLPSALGLYWTIGNLFSILQQQIVAQPKEQKQ